MHKYIPAKLLSLMLVVGVFVFLSAQAHAANFDPANPRGDGVEAEVICIDGVLCDTGSNCSSYNKSPLVRVHRYDILFNRPVRNATIFIEECLRTNAGEICLPAPLKELAEGAENGTLFNYQSDGNTKVSITDDVDGFVKGFQALCRAGNTNDEEAGCNDFEGIKARFMDSLQYKALEDAGYSFLGLYTNAGGTDIASVLSYPTSVSRGQRFEWATETRGVVERFFRAIAFYNMPDGSTGGEGSNQLSVLGFDGDDLSCPLVRSQGVDPKGQVFDAATLQPLEGVKVGLYKKMADGKYELIKYSSTAELEAKYQITDEGFKNPYYTDPMGYFSFIVPNGDYKLLAMAESAEPAVFDVNEELPTTSFGPSSLIMDPESQNMGEQIKVAVSGKEYSLYPVGVESLDHAYIYPLSKNPLTGAVTIPVITVNEIEEQRDIAATGYSPKDARIIAPEKIRDEVGNWIVRGSTNKPFALITAKKKVSEVVLTTGSADVFGKFVIVVPGTSLEVGDEVDVSASAVDLTSLQSSIPATWATHVWDTVIGLFDVFSTKVDAQSTTSSFSFSVEPVYLEGYAYDASGNVMKNAKVSIYDSTSVVSFYTTQTDVDGRFLIPSNKVPKHSYTLEYVSENGGSPVVVEPAKFVEQNKKYLQENNIDLSKAQYDNEAVQERKMQTPPVVISGIAVAQKPANSEGVDETIPTVAISGAPVGPTTPTTQPVSTQLLMLVALLLLLIVGAGLLVVYYMKKKQEPQMYE